MQRKVSVCWATTQRPKSYVWYPTDLKFIPRFEIYSQVSDPGETQKFPNLLAIAAEINYYCVMSKDIEVWWWVSFISEYNT